MVQAIAAQWRKANWAAHLRNARHAPNLVSDPDVIVALTWHFKTWHFKTNCRPRCHHLPTWIIGVVFLAFPHQRSSHTLRLEYFAKIPILSLFSLNSTSVFPEDVWVMFVSCRQTLFTKPAAAEKVKKRHKLKKKWRKLRKSKKATQVEKKLWARKVPIHSGLVKEITA